MIRWIAAAMVFGCAAPRAPAPTRTPAPAPTPSPIAVAHQAPAPQLEPDDIATPSPAVASSVRIPLPAVPAFDLPAPAADGTRAVHELRVAGAPLVGRTIAVKGVITWTYDCVADVRAAGESDRAAQKRIDADPTLCERPKFHIGDRATTPDAQSVWVVDVPRNYNKLELARIAPADRTAPDRCEPNERDPKQRVCPPYRDGDEVVVLGTFAYASPHDEHDSDGLLIYQAMANVTRHWQTPGAALVTPAAPAPPAPVTPAVTAVQPVEHPMRPVADPRIVETSRRQAAAAVTAFTQHQADVARAGFRDAVTTWDGNHLAWYGLGGASAMAGDWPGARDAFERAVRLRPDVATYQEVYGVALYEVAAAQNQPPDPPPAGAFDDAYVHFRQALQLAPTLWRSHYYLGKIERAAGDAKSAAEELSAAIRANPFEGAPYIALAGLYLRWDYAAAARDVATLSTTVIRDQKQQGDAWVELGIVDDATAREAEAVQAFTRALALHSNRARTLFERGQAYFRGGDYTHARGDLAACLAEPDAVTELRGQAAVAKQLLDRAQHR